MHILVISDLHLTPEFNPKLFRFLKRRISDAEEVIINGDFWDGYRTRFNSFVHSAWQDLFPILKAKNTVYVYGNHDREIYTDKRVNLFSHKQSHSYHKQIADKSLIFEHGNELALTIDRWIPRFVSALISPTIMSLIKYYHKLTDQTVPINFNKKIKRKLSKQLKHNEWYICGHSHVAEVDVEARFANSGCMIYSRLSYLTIDKNTAYVKLHWDEL